MTPRGKELLSRFSLAAAFLYALVALQYFLDIPSMEQVPVVQALALSWGFALTALVCAFLPARPRPPHLA